MADFKLLTYRAEGRPRAGILVGERVVDAAEAIGGKATFDATTTLGLLATWNEALPLLARAAEEAAAKGAGRPLAGLRLEAPVLWPGSYFCKASNYYDHALEMNPDKPMVKEGKQPYFFLKPARQSTFGPHDPLRLPRVSQQLDWEIELGVVIGRKARNCTLDNAMECIAGYTILNDVSARDLGRRTDWQFTTDWFGQKAFDSAMGQGPWITPADQIADPYDLAMKLWVNDELMQNSNSGQMIFNIAEQIEYVTRRMTLYPGDVIATGTPAGVGRPRGIFLKPGDTVRMEIAGLGTMENRVEQGG